MAGGGLITCSPIRMSAGQSRTRLPLPQCGAAPASRAVIRPDPGLSRAVRGRPTTTDDDSCRRLCPCSDLARWAPPQVLICERKLRNSRASAQDDRHDLQRPPPLNRRLAEFGTTIFAEMSALALSTGSMTLGQGFPDTDGPEEIREAAVRALRDGRGNQYPPGPGVPEPRTAIAAHHKQRYGLAMTRTAASSPPRRHGGHRGVAARAGRAR